MKTFDVQTSVLISRYVCFCFCCVVVEAPVAAQPALWELLTRIAVMVRELSESGDHLPDAVDAAVVETNDCVGIGAYFPSSGIGVTRSNLLRPLQRYAADKCRTKEAVEDGICEHKGTRHWSLLPGTFSFDVFGCVLIIIFCILQAFLICVVLMVSVSALH